MFKTQARSGVRLTLILALMIGVLFAGSPLGFAPPAQAVTVNGLLSTDVFAFTYPGDSVRIDFQNATKVTVFNPRGEQVTECTGHCSESYQSDVEGVWLVRMAQEGDHRRGATVAVDNSDGDELNGRVWAELWSIGDTGFNSRNLNVYYLSEFGVQYRAEYPTHRGWSFQLEASNRGIMHNDGSCLSAYMSVPIPGYSEPETNGIPAISGNDFTTGDASCATKGLTRYRLFLSEVPDSGMPESTALWADGRTTGTWVYPQYRSPELTELSYEREGFSAAGTIHGVVTGQSGGVRARIDTDNDGDFDGPNDVAIRQNFGLGAFAMAWDGVDGQGTPVPPNRALDIAVDFEGEAEMHLVSSDVEGRGGIRVTRLNGPGAPDTRINWDDSKLPFHRNTQTNPLVGQGADSSGVVHGWTFNGDGWGNERLIEDWMYYESEYYDVITVAAMPVRDISGVAWFDADQNGLRETDEPLLAGVRVSVEDPAGLEVQTSVTNESGAYSFSGLNAKDVHTVRFDTQTADLAGEMASFGVTDASQMSFVAQRVGGEVNEFDSDVDPETGSIDLTHPSASGLVNAGLRADAHYAVLKRVTGPVKAGKRFEMTETCELFRGKQVVNRFGIEHGQTIDRVYPAGTQCGLVESEAGGADATSYQVDSNNPIGDPVQLNLRADGSEVTTVTVNNVFEEAAIGTAGGKATNQGLAETGSNGLAAALPATMGLLGLGVVVLVMSARSRRRHQ